MGTAHPWSQKALRASAGAALRLPIVASVTVESVLARIRRARPKDAISRASDHGFPTGRDSEALHHAAPQIFAACVHPPASCVTTTPEDTDFRGPVALLIGNEGAGLNESILRAADSLIRIPLAAPVESLNAGVAASLLHCEAARQRGRAAQ
jgi:tRNA G18 (ribose-2'-O)-methylase SpoU